MEETLGKRIVANRKRMGLTQDKLAEQLGVTAQAVSKWENDQSCPDITMLPKLAEVFGISADELLGMGAGPGKTVREAEVIEKDSDGSSEEEQESKWEMHWDSGKKNGIGFALLVLLTGGLLLLSNVMELGAGFWDILWPTALVVFGVTGLVNRFSVLRLGCGLFGIYFLLTNLGFGESLPGKDVLLPALLVILGLSLLVDVLRSNRKPHFSFVRHGGKNNRDGSRMCSEYSQSEDGFTCSTSFGGNTHEVNLPVLRSGSANVSFGEMTVDLTECERIDDGCRIEANCSFGELEILIPSSCVVERKITSSFSNVEIDGQPDPDAVTKIILDGNVSFGHLEITYE